MNIGDRVKITVALGQPNAIGKTGTIVRPGTAADGMYEEHGWMVQLDAPLRGWGTDPAPLYENEMEALEEPSEVAA